MTDVGKWMKAGDPLGGEPSLDDADARAMRRAMLAERRTRFNAPWPQPIFVAVTVAITLAAGIVVGRRLPPPRGPVRPAAANRASEPGERRQLQFSTPGGTRIVWVFDSNLVL